jgi:uncharacterized repeat protein (TIGR03803 family)
MKNLLEILCTRNVLRMFLAMNLLLGAAWAQKEKVLYSFCALQNCADGAQPEASLILDQKGNLYGTTAGGGTQGVGDGTVFEVAPSGQERVIYNFAGGTADGFGPFGNLVFDDQGNLYGTTFYGGATLNGTLFKVTPEGQESVLYSFCSLQNCTDGFSPSGGLAFDKEGNLYGTAEEFGKHGYGGVVFKFTPAGEEIVLYTFCALHECADGQGPNGNLVLDGQGNLYGTTSQGGPYGDGTVFKVTPAGKEIVLYSFCLLQNCADGSGPSGGPVFDKEGNLYGMTEYGGENGYGTVFKVTQSGHESVVYSFTGGSDGKFPEGVLVFDKKGNLYGMTYAGGYRYGTVFKVSPSGVIDVLHRFAKRPDGEHPLAGLVFDTKGNLYGTTVGGGTNGQGVVFKLNPVDPAEFRSGH